MTDETRRRLEDSGTKLCALKKRLVLFNISHLKKTGSPIIKMKAVNSQGAASFPAEKAQGLQKF